MSSIVFLLLFFFDKINYWMCIEMVQIWKKGSIDKDDFYQKKLQDISTNRLDPNTHSASFILKYGQWNNKSNSVTCLHPTLNLKEQNTAWNLFNGFHLSL